MTGARRRSASVRTILLLMATGAGLYVAALGTYAVLELEPAARALRTHTGTVAAEYDSLRAQSSTLLHVFEQVRRLSTVGSPTSADQQAGHSLRTTVSAIAVQSAGVQASLVLEEIPPAMRVALADAAGIESRVAGDLVEALEDLDQRDGAAAATWVAKAERAREDLVARLGDAERLGLVNLSERERILGERATRVGQAVAVWIVLGTSLVGLAILVFQRRLYAPLAELERGLARVAQGDLHTSLPVRREDELGRLTAHFNEMTTVLRAHPEVEALRRSEVWFRSLIEHGMDLISVVGADGRFRYVSPTVTALLGYGPAELIGQVGFDYVHPEERAQVQAAFARALGGAGGEIREEFRFRHKDGSWRYFESVVTNLVAEPIVAGLVINSRDITERKEAELALQKSEENLARVFKLVPVAISISDLRDGRLIDVNEAYVNLLGYRRDELVGRTTREVGIWADVGDRRELLRAVEERGMVREYSLRLLTRDGRIREVQGSFQRIELEHGPGLLAAFQDITERREAERLLREIETRFRTAFMTVADAHYIATRDEARIIEVNDRFESVFGYPREEVLGRTSLELGLWANPDDRKRMLAGLRAKGEVRELEILVQRKGGEIIPALISVSPLGSGDPPLILGVVRNITEQREAERLRRESEARLRTAFMTGTDANVIVGRDNGVIFEANDQFLAMYGYRRDEVIGRTSFELGLWAEPGARSRMLTKLAADGHVRNLEVVARRKNGETFPVLYSVTALAGEGPPLLMGVIRDMSEQRRTDEALRSMEEQFRQAQRLEAVGRLAGGVAHDFNNILQAISGYTELLLSGFPGNDPRRTDLEEIRNAGQRATALTRQLLAFSRKQVLQPRVLGLNAVVQGLEKMLRRLIGEDIVLIFTPGAGLGSVKADPGQIEQVLLNLAVNARDAMPYGGRITIETANVELDAAYAREHAGVVPGPYVMAAVSDTGTGMTPETQAHIFEPFFTTKEMGKGTGLGLAMVHGIVNQSGGHIAVDSEPGRGTTFRIYMPRIAQAPESLDLVPPVPLSGGGLETVLIAEDDRAVREVVAETLTQRGYSVLRAPDGRAALAMARSRAGGVDLLLTDIVMPGMTGRELAQALAAEQPQLRVLFMSGYTDDAVVRHGVLEQGVPYLQKPFTTDALALKVREVLDRR